MKRPAGGWEKKREAEKKKLQKVASHPAQRKLVFSSTEAQTASTPVGGSCSGSKEDQALSASSTCPAAVTAPPLPLAPADADAYADASTSSETISHATSGGGDNELSSCHGQGEIETGDESVGTRNGDDGMDVASDHDSDAALDIAGDCNNNSVGNKGLKPQDAVLFLPPPDNASLRVKKAFLKQHPVRPPASTALPFNQEKAFISKHGASAVDRTWLSFCTSNASLYCSTCMCFDSRSESVFVSGFRVIERKDIYSCIEKHERSTAHRAAVSAHVQADANRDIGTLVNEDLASLKAKETKNKRAIVSRVIDILLLIGKQGLAFRGRNEGITDIHDSSVNHGNFLEMAKLLAEYDPVLRDHIKQCIEIASRRRSAPGKKKGRGSLVTFMSKAFLNKVITILGESIQEIAISNVKEAGIFSIEIDSTQDIAAMDQLVIVVRYVSKVGAKETLLTLTVSYDGTGLGLYNKLKEVLVKLGLDIKNIVACSFDGASNMSGCFKGVQARLKEDNPNLIYTHCAAHCLNLVLTNCTEACNAVKTFFGLVQSAAVFVSESHKRMDIWSKVVQARNTGSKKLKRLRKVGKTRWWSKPAALKSIIDADGKSTTNFVDFLLCMNEIGTPLFDAKTTFAALNFRDNWCKFENVLLAFVMVAVFQYSTPVSEALQSPSIDYVVTYSLVDGLLKKLFSLRDQFDVILDRTREYVKLVKVQLEEEGVDFQVDESFAVSRTRNVSSETSEEECQREAAATFRVDVFNCILDHAIQGLRDRFVPNEGLLRDCSLLDPKRFRKDRNIDPDDSEALSTVANLAKVDPRQARVELDGFAGCYDALSADSPTLATGDDSFVDNDLAEILGDLDDEETRSSGCDGDGDEEREPRANCEACRRCLSCALVMFLRFPMLQNAYPSLFSLYKFVLTVPTSQVTCERLFSKLKIIKTRLRNLLSQELLEPLLFLSAHSKSLTDNVIRNTDNLDSTIQRILRSRSTDDHDCKLRTPLSVTKTHCILRINETPRGKYYP